MKTKRKLLAVLTLLSAINHPAFTVLAQTVFVANNSGSTTTAFTILKFDANGNGGIWVSNNGYSGSAWAVPAGVALDSNSNLFVAYSGGSSNFIKRFDAAGNGTIFASFATNFVPGIIAFDSHGNLFVVRHGSTNNIEKFSPAGADLGVFGNLAMQWPDALAFDSQGNLFASDLFGQQILKFNTNGQGTVFVTGDYYRTFQVSEAIDAQKISADYADGVLTLHLPKAESIKPRKIAVSAK